MAKEPDRRLSYSSTRAV